MSLSALALPSQSLPLVGPPVYRPIKGSEPGISSPIRFMPLYLKPKENADGTI
jgi:hypothetical protein